MVAHKNSRLKDGTIFCLWLIITISVLVLSISKYQANPRQFSSDNERAIMKTIVAIDPININTATVDDLLKLPGIGLNRAKAIIACRNEHGKFLKITDLKKVKGISKSVFKNIKDAIIV